MSKHIGKFEIVRNGNGWAVAISIYGWRVLQLEGGVNCNEKNVGKILDILNAAIDVVNNPAFACVCDEDVMLEMALKVFEVKHDKLGLQN